MNSELDGKPRLFIGSSSEGLPVAHAAAACLRSIAAVSVWTDPVFTTGRLLLEEIEKKLKTFDFALLVGTPDDLLFKRTQVGKAMRDNVLFEFGFFIGILGRQRTFLIIPEGESLILPSDLSGLLTARYLHKDGAVDVSGCESIGNAIAEEWQSALVEREKRVQRSLESERSRAIVRLFKVTSGIAETYQTPSDIDVFKSLQEKAQKELDALAERFKHDATLVGIQAEFDEVIAAARNAAQDLPPPDELWEHYKQMRAVVVMRFDPFLTYASTHDSLKRWHTEASGKIPHEWFQAMGLSLQLSSVPETPREKTIEMIEKLAFYTIGAREAVVPLKKIEDRYREWWSAHHESLFDHFDQFNKALIKQLIKQLDPHAPPAILSALVDHCDAGQESHANAEQRNNAAQERMSKTTAQEQRQVPWWRRILR